MKCGYVAKTAENKLGCRAIYPKQIQHTWQKGKMTDIEHDLLPGYVFLYFDSGHLDINAVYSIPGVIRCLSDRDRQYELAGSDEAFAMMLLHKNGKIGKTEVYEIGKTFRIRDGLFGGIEAKILKVNRQKKRMQIEMPFANMQVKTWVEYEIISDSGFQEV